MISQHNQTKQSNPPTNTYTGGIIILDRNKYFFTQLSLISEYLYRYLRDCLQIDGLHMDKYKINQQGDISTLSICYQCQKEQVKEYNGYGRGSTKQGNVDGNDNNIIMEKQAKNQTKLEDSVNTIKNDSRMEDCSQKLQKNININININTNHNNKYCRYRYQITLIQIQQIIKFHIIYNQEQLTLKVSNSGANQNNQKCQNRTQIQQIKEQKLKQIGLDYKEDKANINIKIKKRIQINQQDIIDRQQYSYIDQFWIKYKNYLPKKIYNSYQIQDFDWENNRKCKQKFTHILKQRIAKPIYYQISQLIYGQNTNYSKHMVQKLSPFNQKKGINQLFMTALASNYHRIFKYLKIKEYKHLEMVSKQIYKVLHTQKNYKILFQQKWGRTGFDLDQKNWIKMLEKKTMESKKKSRQSHQGFRVHPEQGIWYDRF